MDILYIATALAIFVAVALLLEGVYLAWNAKYGRQARRVANRLRSMTRIAAQEQNDVSMRKSQNLADHPQAQKLLESVRLANALGRLLAQAGWQITVARFGAISAGIFCVMLGVMLLAGYPTVLAALAAIAAALLPLYAAIRKKNRRMTLLEQQLPEALEMMGRALRAGHSLPSSIKMVAEEVPEPMGGEFLALFNEANYGVPMQDALKNLSARIPGSDIGFFVAAVLIQRETGGNLAELLDTIAGIVRERLKLFAQVKVYSAEGRLSAWILGLLPFGLGALLYLINPGFMSVLWSDPAGPKMIGAVLVLMAIGILWMRSVIRIRV